jgi:hypothetical protein
MVVQKRTAFLFFDGLVNTQLAACVFSGYFALKISVIEDKRLTETIIAGGYLNYLL